MSADSNRQTMVDYDTRAQADVVQSRILKDVKRYGKVFYLELDGDAPMPVLHFGMTGNILVSATVYISKLSLFISCDRSKERSIYTTRKARKNLIRHGLLASARWLVSPTNRTFSK